MSTFSIAGKECVVETGTKASKSIPCGSEAQPCSNLQQCFSRLGNPTTVKVRGKLIVDHRTISIKHSVTIVGEIDAMVIGRKQQYLFKIDGDNIVFGIINVHFSGIRIAYVKRTGMLPS